MFYIDIRYIRSIKHTALGVWMILSHISCFCQEEVIEFQVLLDSLHTDSI